MGKRLQNFLEGRHAYILVDEGLGWVVVLRGEILHSEKALESPVLQMTDSKGSSVVLGDE
jgi:hypothetical protein